MARESLPTPSGLKEPNKALTQPAMASHAEAREPKKPQQTSPIIRKYTLRFRLTHKLFVLCVGFFVILLGNNIISNSKLDDISSSIKKKQNRILPSIASADKLMMQVHQSQLALNTWIILLKPDAKEQRAQNWTQIDSLREELRVQSINWNNDNLKALFSDLNTQLDKLRSVQQSLEDSAIDQVRVTEVMQGIEQNLAELFELEAGDSERRVRALVTYREELGKAYTEATSYMIKGSDNSRFLRHWQGALNGLETVKDTFSGTRSDERRQLVNQLDNLNNQLRTVWQPVIKQVPLSSQLHQHNQVFQSITTSIGELTRQHLDTINDNLISTQEAFHEMKDINIYRALIVALCLLIGMGFVYFIIVVPIVRLHRFTEQVGDGRLDERLVLNQRDEIGVLALSMNEMVAKLKSSYESEHHKAEALRNEVEAILEQVNRVQQGQWDVEFPNFEDFTLKELCDGLQNMVQVLKDDQIEQKKLHKMMAEITSLVENAPMTMMLADESGLIRYINPSGRDMMAKMASDLGLQHNSIVGVHWERLYQDPDALEVLRNTGHNSVSVETEIADDRVVVNSAPVYDASGNHHGQMFTWDIVTALRENERKQREIQRQRELQNQELAQRVEKLKQIVQSVAQGNYDTLVPEFNESTLNELARGLKDMIRSLQHARLEEDRQFQKEHEIQSEVKAISEMVGLSVRNMDGTVGDIVRQSEEAKTRSDIVLDSAKQVNASVSGIATAVEEMSVTTREIAHSVSSSAEISKKAVNESAKARNIITVLGQNSEQVGNVTSVINRIAQQTNLLALNATIEAASAGDAGKGFAVVAGEVKLLAQQTAQATEGITNSIRDIQEDVSRAIQSIASVNEVISEMNEISESISAAIEEQSSTTNDIARSMTDIAQKVEEVVENIQGASQSIDSTRQIVLKGEEVTKVMKDVVQQLSTLVSTLGG